MVNPSSGQSIQTVQVATENPKQSYRFALIPKNINNPFFHYARDGCEDMAEIISSKRNVTVECVFIGPDTNNEGDVTTQLQIDLLDQIIQNKSSWDGVSISVNDADKLTPKINETVANGIPVITFDSDAPHSARLESIETDNDELGRMLAKVLLQINPMGGRYSVISAKASLNIQRREHSVLKRLNELDSRWKLNKVYNGEGSDAMSLEQMYISMEEFRDQEAIISLGGWPMFNGSAWSRFARQYPTSNLTTVVADAVEQQLKAIQSLQVSGLVGQVPYIMGKTSIGEFNASR